MTSDSEPREIEKLLAELDCDSSVWRGDHRELRDLFVDAAEPLAQLLLSVRQAPGHQGFAVVQLLTRGLNDLIVAFHLVLHGYLNQAYNDMRIAWEGCDLIKLLGSNADEATLWIESERPWQDFAPSAVRKKLGKPKLDELYHEFCNQAHPRFEGANLTGYMFQKAGGEPASQLSLGPSPLIDERPYFAHAAMFLGLVLGRITIEARALVDVSNIDEDTFKTAATEMMTRVSAMSAAAVKLAAKSGQPEAAEDLHELHRTLLEPLVDG